MRNNKFIAWIAGAILVSTGASLTSIASAQQAGTATPQAKQWLQLMDTDKDGTVSKAEYLAYMSKQFDKLDVDHDGTLDAKELKQLRGVPATGTDGKLETGKTFSAQQLLLQMDPDKDGTISKQEFLTYAGTAFDKLDGDHDGTLDANELKQLGSAPKS